MDWNRCVRCGESCTPGALLCDACTIAYVESETVLIAEENAAVLAGGQDRTGAESG